MKIYGYEKTEDDDPVCIELSEITLSTSPVVLRNIANFLNKAADDIEQLPDFEHVHLQDDSSVWTDDMPDIVICKNST
ncbi:hypothetical protein tinsulaeT_38850 [Thalassotalea insulae]|uniref:DUF1902 domain-containing protein n=1 Tax=Thalassotalea insulae TaxID=2056778 RepID=A0ABQ6H1B4_9GAMM|nr:hypothetical protein [Thalassotalea insulae]GLX80545.1 hypothetical protein tinsulaeT_38850 [Thalassotalea insulae]